MDDAALSRQLDFAVGCGAVHAFGRALADGFNERLTELNTDDANQCKECGHPRHRKACDINVGSDTDGNLDFCLCTKY
jgi:hypothetical protein